ncbi:MAG: SIS domain-containing protein [Candidatus Paceibacterota bacterium]|jgi:glucose/mannose-6-phosphate isomerase
METFEKLIGDFPKQFAFEPQVVNGENLPKAKSFVVGGMGGSHLAADLIKSAEPTLDLIIHKNYGLPLGENLLEKLFIAISYSGDTEETLDFAEQALKKKYQLACIFKGGKLITFAQKNNLPYIALPEDTELPPRMATGFVMLALLKLMGGEKEIATLQTARFAVEPSKKIAEAIGNQIPIFYASEQNEAIARFWKIIVNETGKQPAFANVFPELNHNEMAGFANGDRISDFVFVFLKDENDNPRIIKRMVITKQILTELNGNILEINLTGGNRWEKIINSALLAHWTAYYIARAKDTDPLTTPIIEKFKKLMAE